MVHRTGGEATLQQESFVDNARTFERVCAGHQKPSEVSLSVGSSARVRKCAHHRRQQLGHKARNSQHIIADAPVVLLATV